MGAGYLGGFFLGQYSSGGSAPDDAVAEAEYFGKYKPEWAAALEDVTTLVAEGFASEHAAVRIDVSDAGR